MFDNIVTVFLDYKEWKTVGIQNFIDEYKPITINYDDREEIVSLYVKGENVDGKYLIDLVEALDSPITLCDRFIGSADTIRLLGLDSWVKY